jgi:large subunit ribosomal protein L5
MAKTRLQEKYLSEAVKGLMDKFKYKNVMEIPKIEKSLSTWALAMLLPTAKLWNLLLVI